MYANFSVASEGISFLGISQGLWTISATFSVVSEEFSEKFPGVVDNFWEFPRVRNVSVASGKLEFTWDHGQFVGISQYAHRNSLGISCGYRTISGNFTGVVDNF